MDALKYGYLDEGMHAGVKPFDNLSNRLQAAFVRLSKDEHLWQTDLQGALRDIASFLAAELEAGCVSVWQMQPQTRRVLCQLRFVAKGERFESDTSLAVAECTGVLGALGETRLISVPDVAESIRSCGIPVPPRLVGPNTGAVMLASLHEAGQLAGMLVVEQDVPRLWNREEQNFLVSVADLLSRLRVFHTLLNRERTYRAVFDAAGDAIFTITDGAIADCNAQALRLFGYPRERIIGELFGVFSPLQQSDGAPSVDKFGTYLMAAREEGPQTFEWTALNAEGIYVEVDVSLSAIWIDGRCQVTAIARDVTERRLTEQIRHASAEVLKHRNTALQVINNLANRLHGSTDAKAIAEETLRVLQVLQRAPLSLFYLYDTEHDCFDLMASVGYDRGPLIPRTRLVLRHSLSQHAIEQRSILHSEDIASDPRVDPDVRRYLLDAGILAQTSLPLMYHDQVLGVICLHFYECGNNFTETEYDTLRAISQTVALALANARHMHDLEFQATHDSLTNLPNRTQLHRDATQALRRIAGSERCLALLLLDLDKFKEINDTLGHRTGDQILKQVAQRLDLMLRGSNAMIARLGGDEFAIVLRDIDGDARAVEIAGQVLQSLREPLEVEGIFLEMGGSIGVAVYPRHGGTSHALLRCADVAMYAAKNSVEAVCLYDNSHDTHNPRRLAMITELGAAIRGNQMIVYYQPRYGLQNGRWCGCEALVRWQHPRLGFIPPGEFVQFAETSELIRPLTLWVARQAIMQLAQWLRDGLQISVSINLSTRNLLDVTLPEALAELLEQHDVPPGLLELEITETALMTDPERAMQVVHRLAALGMHMSIDDFGTGYSSLAYLKRLPLQFLKIDRSFVQDMLHDEQDAIIVRSTIGLAHSLGLQVVAEGVEDFATLERLREYGADEAQGYVLSRPQPPEHVWQVMQQPPQRDSGDRAA